MRPNFSFLSAASNALLKPGGLLKWKVRLVKLTSSPFDASSVIAKAKTEAWQTTCSSLSLKSVHSLLRSIAGSPSSSFSSSPNFPNCSSPRESVSVYAAYLRSHFSFSQPEATSLSSAEPRALWSLTRPFALLSLSLNFLQLPPTFPPPPLAQTKLPILC